MAGRAASIVHQTMVDDGDDDIWDDGPAFSYEEEEYSTSIDEEKWEEWTFPQRYRAKKASSTENQKLTSKHSGHRRSMGKIFIDCRSSDSTAEAYSSSPSVSSHHSRASTSSRTNRLLTRQQVSPAVRRSQSKRYLDDDLSKTEAGEDLFMLFHRSTSASEIQGWRGDGRNRAEELLDVSSPEFDSFENVFRDKPPIFNSEDEFDWSTTCIDQVIDLSIKESEERWDKSFCCEPPIPTLDIQGNAHLLHESKSMVESTEPFDTNVIHNDPPMANPSPEQQLVRPLPAHRGGTARTKNRTTTQNEISNQRRSSPDSSCSSRASQQRSSRRGWGTTSSRYCALPRDGQAPQSPEPPAQLPPALAFLARKAAVLRIPKVETKKQIAKSRLVLPPKCEPKEDKFISKDKGSKQVDPLTSSTNDEYQQSAEPIKSRREPAWLRRLQWNAEGAKQKEQDKIWRSEAVSNRDLTEVSSFDLSDEVSSRYKCTIRSADISSKPLMSQDQSQAIQDNKVKETQQLLMWSKRDEEAIQNGSDWLIVVVTGWSEIDDVETYHVHKNVVGHGQRSSSFLKQKFQIRDSNSNCILELENPLAKAFEDMLDFVYSPPCLKHLEQPWFRSMHPHRAKALRTLAAKMGVSELREAMDHATAASSQAH